jgi:LPXTG-motif cell wall-anchored protein
MDKPNGKHFIFLVLGVVICGIPNVLTTLLNVDLPTWVTVIALIVGICLVATGAFFFFKSKKQK